MDPQLLVAVRAAGFVSATDNAAVPRVFVIPGHSSPIDPKAFSSLLYLNYVRTSGNAVVQ